MKTAGRRIPNRRAHPPGNRAHGAEDRNRSRLISWAAKQGSFQPQGTFFLLTSTFIELTRPLTPAENSRIVAHTETLTEDNFITRISYGVVCRLFQRN